MMDVRAVPGMVKASELDAVRSADYCPEYYAQIEDFYAGGRAFEQRKEKYLNRRQLDDTTLYRNARLDAARYNNHLAPLIDFLTAACLQAKPQAVVEGADPSEYWCDLNKDVDGAGTDLAALATTATALFLKHHRAYLLVNFPEPLVASSKGEQETLGLLDARLAVLGAADVPYYEYAPSGALTLVVVKRVQPEASGFGKPTREIHTWTYIGVNGLAEYSAVRPIGANGWGDEFASITRRREWNTGLPVFAVGGISATLKRMPWIADRLLSTCVQIFNLESALAFSLYTSAYAQLVISDDQVDLKRLIASEMSCIKLSTTGKMYYVVPENTAFDALATEVERLKTNLYASINSAALQLPNSESNGRQSGVAKFMDFGAITVLVESFSSLVRDALEGAIRYIGRVRADGVEVELRGLDEFDISQGAQAFDLLQKLLAVEDLPETARKLAKKRMIVVAFGGEIPPEEMGEIENELQADNGNGIEPQRAQRTQRNGTENSNGDGIEETEGNEA